MTGRGLALALVTGSAMLVVACGSEPRTAAAPVAVSAAAPPTAAITASPLTTPPASPTAAPTPPPPPPSTVVPATARPTPAPMQPMTASMSSTFAIRPLVGGGPNGSVTVTTSNGGVRYHVVVSGLAPGSRHTIHDHLGRCSNAGGSQHLDVLATLAADGSGVIVIDRSVGAFLSGPGRIVIVYSNATTDLITGCADL
jgi:hypothetical protein